MNRVPEAQAPQVEVHKFGGGVLKSKGDYGRAAGIVKGLAGEGKRVVAVVSAKNGVTNRLIALLESARDKKPFASLERDLNKLREEHEEICSGTVPKGDFDKVFGEMKGILSKVHRKSKFSPRQYDNFASRGEELSALALSTHLPDFSISKPEDFIITRGRHGNAAIDLRRTKPPLYESILPGFYGGTTLSRIPFLKKFASRKLVGRGGTDLSAAAAGLALNADQIVFWKDNLLASANPGDVGADKVKYYHQVPRRVAEEAAAHGASIFHHHAIALVANSRAEIWVKDVNHPGENGTLLSSQEGRHEGELPVIIARKDKQSIVSIEGSGFVANPGVVVHIKQALAKAGISFDVVGTGERLYAFSIDSSEQERAKKALEPAIKKLNKRFHETGNPFEMKVAGGYSLIGVIRENATHHELQQKIAAAFHHAKVSPEMVSIVGHSASYVVESSDAREVVKALHQKLVENK